MWRDLSPTIYRQRLVIEGIPAKKIVAQEVDRYLIHLSKLLKMTLVAGPLTRSNPRYGCSSYIYWEESGTHFYAWDKPFPFFSVDIYACKKFKVRDTVDFTKKYFKANKIMWKQV